MSENSHSPSWLVSALKSFPGVRQFAPGAGRGARTGPAVARLADDDADVLLALFRLAGEVEGRGEDQVRVRAPHLDLGVVAAHVHLRRREGLLADGHALAELLELCAAVSP
jgi:hypothetical protein